MAGLLHMEKLKKSPEYNVRIIPSITASISNLVTFCIKRMTCKIIGTHCKSAIYELSLKCVVIVVSETKSFYNNNIRPDSHAIMCDITLKCNRIKGELLILLLFPSCSLLNHCQLLINYFFKYH